jgi:hypothetical protein
MIKITDKSFRYTPSYETDLRKKFKKIDLERRSAEARKAAEAVNGNSVVTMVARRSISLPKA